MDQEFEIRITLRLGTQFIAESNDQIYLNSYGQVESYTRLCNLEFDSGNNKNWDCIWPFKFKLKYFQTENVCR